jgi:hypothetical protein
MSQIQDTVRSDDDILAEAGKMMFAFDLVDSHKKLVETVMQNDGEKWVAKLEMGSNIWSVEWIQEMTQKPREVIEEMAKEKQSELQTYLYNLQS